MHSRFLFTALLLVLLNGDCHADESEPSDESLLKPADFHYVGAFRLPPQTYGGSNWEYSGYAMTCFPEGDPHGAVDGYPGSLFIVGHDHHQMISEVDIPAPVISRTKDLNELPTATTLQPFASLRKGLADDLEIPRLGIEILTEGPKGAANGLHFAIGQHFEFDRRPTHGWKGLDLGEDDCQGLWHVGEYSAYVLNDYLFEIPVSWSDQHLPGYRLATGRFRDGQWGGLGPAIVAYQPPSLGEPLPPGATITTFRPLLMYGTPQTGSAELAVDSQRSMNHFSESDEWSGGAWLTTTSGKSDSSRSAVMLLGTKAVGKTWYGFSNGVEYPISGDPNAPIPEVPAYPHDQRGWWSESIAAQAILFAADHLASVARGDLQSWQPQPYAVVDLTPYLFEKDFEHVRQKRYLLGACAYDRGSDLLYVVERRVKADDERSLVHVFRIGRK